jgi:4'-phosphopantetheinyl transferase EntD
MTARRSARLAALFPPGVEVFTLDDHGPAPDLMPAESDAVSGAVPKRRAEFARGRACARAALRELGIGSTEIPIGPDRAPIWPVGAIGSITHCDGLIAAAACRAERFAGIGLDAEPRGPLDPELIERIATDHELARAGASGLVPPAELPRLIFSAKEVVHKCVHPSTQIMLDFLDVVVTFDHATRVFEVEPAGAGAQALAELRRIDGRYWFDADHLVTAAVVRRV